MSLHRLEATQRLAVSPEEAWAFFSDPRNLAAITPPGMGFVVRGELPAVMHPGMIVVQTVRPLLGIPVTWVTEISHVIEGRLFVDEQRFGPYRFWHHQHHFQEIPGGIEMRDIVHYSLPFGPFGDAVNALLVRRRVRAIFAFRHAVLEQRFGAPVGSLRA
jgi:ligand-binding SRPBCC domain-containing protein